VAVALAVAGMALVPESYPTVTTVVWGALVPIGVTVVLSAVVWTTSAWTLRTRRGPGPRYDEARTPVQAVAPLAIATSLLWLVWRGPGPLQGALIAAVTVALSVPKSWWLERRVVARVRRILAPPARYFTRRVGVLGLIRRLWSRIPAAGRKTILLLVLLNVAITLLVINTAELYGGWAVHTTIVFAVMSGVNLVLLKFSLPPSRRTRRVAPQVHFSSLKTEDAVTAYRYNGHAHVTQLRLAQLRSNGQAERFGTQPLQTSSAPAREPAKSYRIRKRRFRSKIHPAVAVGAVILAVGWIGLVHPGLLLILAVLVVGSAIMSTMEVSLHRAIIMVLAIALGVATVDYMSWRFSVTNWAGWWLAVPLLCAEALGAVHVLGFQFTVWPWPAPALEPSEDPTRHAIFILIPTLNEGVVTLRPTLEGCLAARQKYLTHHPDGEVTIVVCNDGRAAQFPHWAEIDMLAAELGVRCVTRITGGGAKAGNIENARRSCQITDNALLVIFDADQVPKPDFLLKTIPPFADTKVGWVQTGQYYANLNNPVSRWADDQQSMFYNLLCPGKAALNAAFICGTNVVIRAAALDEIGGLPQDSVTEDFAASIALHPRWRSVYLTDVLATGLGPLDIPSYLKQQGRWALGTLGVFRSHWRDIMLPRRNGLRLGQRVQYFLACTHYLCGLRDLIYVLSPVLFIFTGVPAVRTATLNQYLLHFLPYALLGMTAMWYSARGVTGLRGIIIGFGSSPVLIGSLVAVILRRKRPFAVTSKESQERRSLRYLDVYAVFMLLCIAALVWATQATGRQRTSLFISLLWVIYSLVMLTSFLCLARADIRLHEAAGRAGTAEITAKHPYPAKLLVRRNSPRPVLNLGLAALVATPLLLGARLASWPAFFRSAPPFVIAQRQIEARYTGVSLPLAMLNQVPVLARELGTRLSIVGRTQDISDRFDTAWAEALAAHGARPWVTLEFGAFGPHHKLPLAASLPAIFNGVDDQEITRWAVEIRDFANPVYLTVLLQVDKNWAVSSGVANGGIPEDVPKAWLHIQSIFRAVGANNVAWVWAPADPLHDQRFAPPPSTIDVVLQDFINYPGTHWGDPKQVLHSLVHRYPGKSIFVEVSVAGPAAQKAAWLARLGQAVDGSPQVYGLLYHQGGPGLKPTPAQAKSWSLASDPQSLAAWKHIVDNLHPAGRLP
jgi:cellulose synthase/poly-beta-1,6-N-acetylglucosamine synthase-like glycosyltransferase